MKDTKPLKELFERYKKECLNNMQNEKEKEAFVESFIISISKI